jgi:hypothetical protein
VVLEPAREQVAAAADRAAEGDFRGAAAAGVKAIGVGVTTGIAIGELGAAAVQATGVGGSGKAPSKIDRNAFKAEREAYWKAEAQNNAGQYSAEDLSKMEAGRAPTGPDGAPMELHHVDRTPEGGLKPMSRTEHRLGENYKKNHP